MNKFTLTKMITVTPLTDGALSSSAAAETPAKFESQFYKDRPLFSTYPKRR